MPAKVQQPKRSKAEPPKKNAARKSAASGVSLNAALAEAAWREADTALAEALADFDEVQSAGSAAQRNEALALLGQSLTRAARKRGLSRIGELGAVAPFDAVVHDLNAPVVKTPDKVRIQARGVARGSEVLQKLRVTPQQRKRRT
jgi:hypothetical protein